MQNGFFFNKLESYWPNLKMGAIYSIWEYEYWKYGYCFFPSQEAYFQLTVRMVERIPDLTSDRGLHGCIPNFYIA